MSETVLYSDSALAMLKTQLGYHGTEIPLEIDTQLKADLIYAYKAITRSGVSLTVGNVFDDQLQAMYAHWLYRKRRDGSAKPPMITQEIRDRQIANALSEEVSE